MSPRPTDPYRPRTCDWELTAACNLKCGHCGSGAGRPRPKELSTAECLDVVDQLADLECRRITLSGGEPTLRAFWDVIARRAARKGIVVNMVTNGTTMTADLAARIADTGLANVAVLLDGTPHVHEAARGAGTFHKVARAMRFLKHAGVSTSMITRLNRDTFAELEDIHDIALELGASAWRVQLAGPSGDLSARDPGLLRPEDLLDLMPRMAWLKKTSPIWVDVGDSIGYYGPYENQLRERPSGGIRPMWNGCQAGLYTVGIQSDGGVKGCLSLQSHLKGPGAEDPFREGDLRTRRLVDIWFDPRAFAYNRHTTEEDLTGECGRCGFARHCRGGAKCVAAAFTGRLDQNPYCYHRVQMLQSRRRRAVSSLRKGTAAAMLSVGLGLSTVFFGGCADRAVEGRDCDCGNIPTGYCEPE